MTFARDCLLPPASKISIQYKADDDERGSAAMLVADRAEGEGEQYRPVIGALVLVVDADDALRESLVRVLAECDMTALGAASRLEALDILRRTQVDVIVADQFIRGLDGVALLSDVRQRWPHVRRILFMGDPAADIVLDAVNRAGVHKVLLRNMHAVRIRDEIESVGLAALRERRELCR